MRSHIITFAVVGFFVCTPFVEAAMTSTNFEIRWDTVSTGGSDTASSASYLLRDTAESTVAGIGSSSSYQLRQGYRVGVDDQILTFEVVSQNTAGGHPATALSGLTVTAATTGISVNSLIAVIQDAGASQVTAIGRVASLGSGTITVDAWKNAGTQPTIDGANDYMYPLTSASVSFNDLSTTAVVASIVAFEVSSANDNGYVVQVFDDGNLRSGAADIDDVSDGTVSASSEEYGGRSSDTSISTSIFDTADSAITTTSTDVATESAAIFSSRNFVTLKAAISSSTTIGSYAHTISFIASGNF